MNPHIGPAVRFRVAVVAVFAALAGFTPAAVIAAPTGGCTNVQTRGAWTTINPPSVPYANAFDPGATSGPSLVVTGGLRGRFFATYVDQIFRSTDAGCTWTPVYTFHQTGVPSDPTNPATVARLENAGFRWIATATYPATAHPAPGGDLVYAVIDCMPDVTCLAVSRDGGTTWRTTVLEVPTSVPSVTEPIYATGQLQVSPADPQVAYLSGQAPSRWASRENFSLYVTKDGGNSWTYLGPEEYRLVADPTSAPTLWSFKPGDTFEAGDTRVSTDYGQTWIPVPRPPSPSDPIRLLDVRHQAGRPAQLLVANRQTGNDPTGFAYSGNGGLSWSVIPPPPPALLGSGWDYAGAPLLASPQGDILAWITLRSQPGVPAPPPVLYRWFAKQHRWRPLNCKFPSLGAGNTATGFAPFTPIDTSRRYLFGGLKTVNGGVTFVVYDSRVPRPL